MKVRVVVLTAVLLLAAASVVVAQLELDELLGDAADAKAPYPVGIGIEAPIRVSVDAGLGIEPQAVRWLLGQSSVLNAAARDVDAGAAESATPGEVLLTIDGQATPCRVDFESTAAREVDDRSIVTGKLKVSVGPTRGPIAAADREKTARSFRQTAERIADAMAKRLEQSLVEIGQRQAKRRAEQADSLEEAYLVRAQQELKRIDDLMRQLNSLGLGGLPEPVLVQNIGELGKRKQDLELELAGLEARSQVLQKQLQVAAKRADAVSQTDEVVQNFRRVVDLQTRRLQHLQAVHASGQAGQDELNQAEIELAAAKVDLAQAERAPTLTATIELDRLNAELAKAAVSTAECQAKLKYAIEHLARNLENWQQESRVGETLRNRLSVARKAAALFEEEAQRRQVEQIRDAQIDAIVEAFSVPADGSAKAP